MAPHEHLMPQKAITGACDEALDVACSAAMDIDLRSLPASGMRVRLLNLSNKLFFFCTVLCRGATLTLQVHPQALQATPKIDVLSASGAIGLSIGGTCFIIPAEEQDPQIGLPHAHINLPKGCVVPNEELSTGFLEKQRQQFQEFSSNGPDIIGRFCTVGRDLDLRKGIQKGMLAVGDQERCHYRRTGAVLVKHIVF